MSKKTYIILISVVIVLVTLSIFFIVRGNMQNKTASNNVEQAIDNTLSPENTDNVLSTEIPINTPVNIPISISWIFESYIVKEHTTNEVTSTTVSAVVNGETFKIGVYPGKAEEIKDFATYDMPSDSLSACKSVLLTGGDYFYIIRKDNTSLSVMTRFMDDAIEKANKTKSVYKEKTVINIPSQTPIPT